MGESQFEKLRKIPETNAERTRNLLRHTIYVQDEIINELRDDYLRLRGLLRKCFPHLIVDCIDDDLLDEVQKEVGDE